MSETTKEVEKLEEVNAAVKDAAPGEATHLKNDAVDMGAPVVKPTDKNPDAASKAKQNTSDPALKSAKDGSNPAGKGDMKPTSMKEEEVEIEATEDQEVVAEEETKEVKRYNEQFINKKRAFGELGHPDGPTVNLERVSHMITSLKPEGKNFIGEAKIMDTPYGKIVKN